MRALVAAVAAAAALFLTPSQAQDAWPGSYPEGPVWVGETLYWAEMRAHRVMRWDGNEPEVFYEAPGCGPTAIAPFLGGGDLLILCHLAGSLHHLDQTGTLRDTILGNGRDLVLRNPNDAASDHEGGVWFTDPGPFFADADPVGRLYHLSPGGTLTLAADGLAYGNGVHVDRQGKRLLLSEHLARRVLAYPIAPWTGEPEVLVDLDALGLRKPAYPEAGPDGLEIGPDGTLWIAEYGARRLLGWRDGRGLVAALQVDTDFVTNIAFSSGGLAAMTGAYQNDRPPYRGATWVFDAQGLSDAARAE